VNDATDALRERLGIHAQLEKQEALETLLVRSEVATAVFTSECGCVFDSRLGSPDYHLWLMLHTCCKFRMFGRLTSRR